MRTYFERLLRPTYKSWLAFWLGMLLDLGPDAMHAAGQTWISRGLDGAPLQTWGLKSEFEKTEIQVRT